MANQHYNDRPQRQMFQQRCLASFSSDFVIRIFLDHPCPILITCSSRESGYSTRTSRTTRKTMVTIGSIVQVVMWHFSVK